MIEKIDELSTAVLVLHYQKDVVSVVGKEPIKQQLHLTEAVVRSARSKGIAIFFANMGFSDNYEEVHKNNKNGNMLKEMNILRGDGVDPVIEKSSNDRLFIPSRISAFYETDLDEALRREGIDTLIMMGITTSGVMLSTLSNASDLDYRIFAVKDCCYDPDAIAHEKIFSTAFTTRAHIVSANEVIAGLESIQSWET